MDKNRGKIPSELRMRRVLKSAGISVGSLLGDTKGQRKSWRLWQKATTLSRDELEILSKKRKVRGGLARSSNANGKAHMSTNQYDCYVCNMMIIVFWKDKGLALHNFFHDSYFSGLWKVDPLDDSTHLELSWAICGRMTWCYDSEDF